ncbi:60Kd inner membrane protein-domain-containing protein [Entophlyctis helioformis]|nr:60Kd inner membrane protein-domain-containing protein [Entophlyctis helioformis]
MPALGGRSLALPSAALAARRPVRGSPCLLPAAAAASPSSRRHFWSWCAGSPATASTTATTATATATATTDATVTNQTAAAEAATPTGAATEASAASAAQQPATASAADALPNLADAQADLEPLLTPIEALANTSSASPVSALVHLMDTIHTPPDWLIDAVGFVGMPWWLTIVSTTVALRTICTLPLAVQNKMRSHRLKQIQPLLEAWERTIGSQLQRQARTPSGKLTWIAERAAELYRIHRCHPFYTFILPWVQVPLFISMSFALRWLVAYPVPWLGTPGLAAHGLTDEGILWFDNLTLADPTLITPIMVGALHLINMELNSSLRPSVTTGQRAFRLFLQSLVLFMVPVAASIPMAITLYWLASAMFSVIQNAAFWTVERHPAVVSVPRAYVARAWSSLSRTNPPLSDSDAAALRTALASVESSDAHDAKTANSLNITAARIALATDANAMQGLDGLHPGSLPSSRASPSETPALSSPSQPEPSPAPAPASPVPTPPPQS